MAAFLMISTVFLVVLSTLGAAGDTKLFFEMAKQFDPGMLTRSCRRVFQKCKERFAPLVLVAEDLLSKTEKLMELECVNHELQKGFPRFDLECVMSDDYKEGLECMDNPDLLALVGPRAAKTFKSLKKCFVENTPDA